jgi:hypothetical protein
VQKLRGVEEQRRRVTQEAAARAQQRVAEEHAHRLTRLQQEWKESAAVKKARRAAPRA